MMALSALGTIVLERLVEKPNGVMRSIVGLAGASLAVEMFAWSDKHHGEPLAEAFHTPGREIQRRLATKEPTPEQLEVGLAAMAEILRAEQRAETDTAEVARAADRPVNGDAPTVETNTLPPPAADA
jgi:uncharacterized protein YqhQ